MYAKIFAQMYDGTLCTNGTWQALVTFQQLLILADQDGNVDMTIGAISRRTTIPKEIIETGIAELLLPDSESRTPAHDGRRIVPLAEGRLWGWRVVNYTHYRQLHREIDRREYHRQYWHQRKAKECDSTSHDSTDSTPTQKAQLNQPIAYAEAEAEAEAEAINTGSQAAKRPVPSAAKLPTCPTQAIIDLYHEVLPELPAVRLQTKGRTKAISKIWTWVMTSVKHDGARRAETAEQALSWLSNYFERARENDFLMGRAPRSGSHANWRCDLDFLLTERGMKHVIEKTPTEAS